LDFLPRHFSQCPYAAPCCSCCCWLTRLTLSLCLLPKQTIAAHFNLQLDFCPLLAACYLLSLFLTFDPGFCCLLLIVVVVVGVVAFAVDSSSCCWQRQGDKRRQRQQQSNKAMNNGHRTANNECVLCTINPPPPTNTHTHTPCTHTHMHVSPFSLCVAFTRLTFPHEKPKKKPLCSFYVRCIKIKTTQCVKGGGWKYIKRFRGLNKLNGDYFDCGQDDWNLSRERGEKLLGQLLRTCPQWIYRDCIHFLKLLVVNWGRKTNYMYAYYYVRLYIEKEMNEYR